MLRKNFTIRDTEVCLRAGFKRAWIEQIEHYGRKRIALCASIISSSEPAGMIELRMVRDGIGVQAWVLFSTSHLDDPIEKRITVADPECKSGYAGGLLFDSIKVAAEAALKNPLM